MYTHDKHQKGHERPNCGSTLFHWGASWSHTNLFNDDFLKAENKCYVFAIKLL